MDALPVGSWVRRASGRAGGGILGERAVPGPPKEGSLCGFGFLLDGLEELRDRRQRILLLAALPELLDADAELVQRVDLAQLTDFFGAHVGWAGEGAWRDFVTLACRNTISQEI